MKSNRRLKNSLLLFGCPLTQDTHLTTLLGCTRKMKRLQFAPLAMITQRHWGCLGPREVCHLQLPGEQGRSKGTEWAAILRTQFQHRAQKKPTLHSLSRLDKEMQGRTGTEEIWNSAIPSALEPKRKHLVLMLVFHILFIFCSIYLNL